MKSWTYIVIDTEGCVVATGMNLENALILVKALMQEYYAEPSMFFTIGRKATKEET